MKEAIKALVFAVSSFGLMACSMRLEPPTNLQNPVNVFVSDYGDSSGLIFALEGQNYLEYAWGDWEYMALNERGFFEMLEAGFFSQKSALGRREKSVQQEEDLAARFSAEKLLKLEVEKEKQQALVRKLNERFQSLSDQDTAAIFNPYQDMHFVPSDTDYSVFYNSNHRVRDWLKELGVKTSGWSFRSSFN